MQTPVDTVGRFTIERIDPHGSPGALAVGEVAGRGELDGAGAVCPETPPFGTAKAQRKDARAMSPVLVTVLDAFGKRAARSLLERYVALELEMLDDRTQEIGRKKRQRADE